MPLFVRISYALLDSDRHTRFRIQGSADAIGQARIPSLGLFSSEVEP
jgi:hypothetical protein